MSRTITIANDVEKMLEKYRVNVIDITGKEKPSYSDIIRFILKQRSSGCNGRT
jgi:predicted CopG family antitoxin